MKQYLLVVLFAALCTAELQEPESDGCYPIPELQVEGHPLVRESRVTLVALLDASRPFCIKQARDLKRLATNLNKNGLRDVDLLIINAGSEESQANSHQLMRAAYGIPMVVEESEGQLWGPLEGSKDDMIVIDRCGRVAFHLKMPWSILTAPYVRAAVLATFHDNPCGECPTTPPPPAEIDEQQEAEDPYAPAVEHQEEQELFDPYSLTESLGRLFPDIGQEDKQDPPQEHSTEEHLPDGTNNDVNYGQEPVEEDLFHKEHVEELGGEGQTPEETFPDEGQTPEFEDDAELSPTPPEEPTKWLAIPWPHLHPHGDHHHMHKYVVFPYGKAAPSAHDHHFHLAGDDTYFQIGAGSPDDEHEEEEGTDGGHEHDLCCEEETGTGRDRHRHRHHNHRPHSRKSSEEDSGSNSKGSDEEGQSPVYQTPGRRRHQHRRPHSRKSSEEDSGSDSNSKDSDEEGQSPVYQPPGRRRHHHRHPHRHHHHHPHHHHTTTPPTEGLEEIDPLEPLAQKPAHFTDDSSEEKTRFYRPGQKQFEEARRRHQEVVNEMKRFHEDRRRQHETFWENSRRAFEPSRRGHHQHRPHNHRTFTFPTYAPTTEKEEAVEVFDGSILPVDEQNVEVFDQSPVEEQFVEETVATTPKSGWLYHQYDQLESGARQQFQQNVDEWAEEWDKGERHLHSLLGMGQQAMEDQVDSFKDVFANIGQEVDEHQTQDLGPQMHEDISYEDVQQEPQQPAVVPTLPEPITEKPGRVQRVMNKLKRLLPWTVSN